MYSLKLNLHTHKEYENKRIFFLETINLATFILMKRDCSCYRYVYMLVRIIGCRIHQITMPSRAQVFYHLLVHFTVTRITIETSNIPRKGETRALR